MFEQDTAGIDMNNRRLKEAVSPIPGDQGEEDRSRQVRRRRKRKGIDLDSDEILDLHSICHGLYQRELSRQYENRLEQAIDEDFYDNIQWDEADAQTLKDRGQIPLVYNVIATSLNWVTGTQKRSRMDYKVLPRRKDDAKPAERKSALLKYLSDVNRTPFARSKAFEDSAKVGVGWLECGKEDTGTGDPVYSRYESWRNMLWDSAATEDDLTDARFVSRAKWVDTDILTAMFPNRRTLIDESIDENAIYAAGIESDGDEAMDSREIATEQAGTLMETLLGINRPRVRVIEMWFRRPAVSYQLRGGMFSGDVYDFSDAHDEEIRSGRARIEKKRLMRMYVMLFTSKGVIWYGESPYRHNRFPFTPIWANRRGRDGMPYGMIRGLRDIQTDINKRASKALYILSSNKVIMDEGALPDDMTMEEFEDEVARPDAIIQKKKGYELKLDVERNMAEAHLELMSRSIMMIQQTSGVTDELMGRKSNATSGIAIQRRQDQGSTTTTNLFDRLRFAMQVHGEKELSLIEQYYTDEKEFRITSMRGTPEYVKLNSGLPDDDITRTKADYIISDADWHASLRQAAAESLLEAIKLLAPAAPQVAISMIDLVVENMDLPNRAEIVKRIRSATGMPDPDAEGPTPEQVRAERAKAMLEQMQFDTAKADLDKKMADAEQSRAKAAQIAAQARKTIIDARTALTSAAGASVDVQAKAIDAALKLLQAPDASPIADHMLTEAGFESEPERQGKEQALLAAIDQADQQRAAAASPPAAAQPQPVQPPPEAPTGMA